MIMKKLFILSFLAIFSVFAIGNVSAFAKSQEESSQTQIKKIPVKKVVVKKKPIAKKPVSKKPVAKKPVAKKPAPKKPVASKSAEVKNSAPVKSGNSNIELKSSNTNVSDADGAPVCKVSPGDDVVIVAEHEDGKRFKIKINKKGCPEEGFVTSDEAKFKGERNSLEIVTDGNGPKKDCVNCTNPADDYKAPSEKNIEVVKDVKNKLNSSNSTKNLPGASLFISELRSFIKNPRVKPDGIPVSRGLVQFPVKGSTGTIGPCGSVHYNPNTPRGEDVYANPLTACVFASVLQDWKKNHCPNNSGCTMQFGDISDRDNPCWNKKMRGGRCPRGSTHLSHTNGYCIDVRPLTKGGLNYGPVTYNSPNYDREATKKLIEFYISQGADTSQLFFNDPKLIIEGKSVTVKKKGKTVKTMVKLIPRSDREGIHNNHIHVCFKNNKKTNSVCSNLKVDQDVCPELK